MTNENTWILNIYYYVNTLAPTLYTDYTLTKILYYLFSKITFVHSQRYLVTVPTVNIYNIIIILFVSAIYTIRKKVSQKKYTNRYQLSINSQ